MRFSVPIQGYGDPRYPNRACFVDYVRAVVSALRSLGHEVVPPTVDGFNVDKTARPIVFASQNLHSVDDARDPGSFLPDNAILYNSEQAGARGVDPIKIFDGAKKEAKSWQKRTIWDYSEVNAAALRKLGCERVILCPVAYDKVMERITPLPPEEEDIDVLFYGSAANANALAPWDGFKLLDRKKILTDCARAGLHVKHVFGIYADDLDPLVRRAKVVLNLHYYEGAVHEIFRCSQLYANKKCVVTEDGGCDETLEAFARKASCYVERKNVVEACVEMVNNLDKRRAQAEKGYEEFKKTSLADNIKKALEQS